MVLGLGINTVSLEMFGAIGGSPVEHDELSAMDSQALPAPLTPLAF